MPGLNGFEVLSELSPQQIPLIVFVTAYNQYALQAFEVNAVDYVMKPVEQDRLARAVAKLRDRSSRDGVERLVAALQKGRTMQP